MVKRPYMKYLIAGGVVSAQGGPFLVYGLEIIFLLQMMPGDSFILTLGTVFSIIGAISLCVGLSLLYKGVIDRKIWYYEYHKFSTTHSTYFDEDEPIQKVERPIMKTSLIENSTQRYCPACGVLLPNLPKIKFCPKCGEDLS